MRVLVFRIGADAHVEDVENPFTFAKTSLIGGGDIEALTLEDGVVVYCNEHARNLEQPLNREIPARMPEFPADMFIVDTEPDKRPAPGQWGVHRIYGNFLLTRHGDEDCIDITDRDIEKYRYMPAVGTP